MRCSLVLALASLAFAAPAPLIETADSSRRIPHKYIVKLKDVVSRSARDETLSLLSSTADQVYDGGIFNGFAATLETEELELLRNHSDVEYIEEDAIFTVDFDIADDDTLAARQVLNPWNLIRISHRANTGTTFLDDGVSGTGTCIYILDSGVNTAHPNFGGRAFWAANFVDSSSNDANGHGTAIAGVAAATQVGASRRSRVLAVKVINDSGAGTTSGIIQGLSFVAADAPNRNCLNGGAFVNFAAVGAYSAALNNAASGLVAQGHFLAADAGNSNAPVSSVSPASAQGVCVAGPTNAADVIPTYANYGGVDIYAPGVQILSLRNTGGTVSYGSLSPTAHVTGVAAYVSTLAGLPPNQICNFLWQTGTPNVLQGVIDARLLYNGGQGY